MTQTIITKRKPQENWKRTQIRLPPELHEKLTDYADSEAISINSALISMLEHGLLATEQNQGVQIDMFEHKFNHLSLSEQQLIMQLIERFLQGKSS